MKICGFNFNCVIMYLVRFFGCIIFLGLLFVKFKLIDILLVIVFGVNVLILILCFFIFCIRDFVNLRIVNLEVL